MSIGVLADVLFTGLLVTACVSDVRTRRIPNSLVLAVAFGGLVHALAIMPPLAALERALAGGLAGLALWLPFWLARVLGAGDVKLAAASGAWLGVAGILEASLLGAAVGGVVAVWALARHGGPAAALERFGAWMVASRSTGTLALEMTPRERRVPYGVAIAAGAIAAAWLPGLIW